MVWKPELDDLARREAFARGMGGVEKVKRQRDQGRLTVRERIETLTDQTSFHENGAVAGIADDGPVKTIETRGAANLPGGVGSTRLYWFTTANLARVPVVGLGLGSVAGLGAARLAATHYSIMTKNSAMFVAGPPVVKRLGQDLSKQELGGAEIQTRAGGIDHAVDTEDEAFECARRV